MKKVTIIEATSRVDNTGDRKRLRVAAYVRVSTEEDEQKKSSAFSMGFVLFSHTNNKGTHRVPLLLSKVGNLYDYSFKVGNKCRLIIDKQEFVK